MWRYFCSLTTHIGTGIELQTHEHIHKFTTNASVHVLQDLEWPFQLSQLSWRPSISTLNISPGPPKRGPPSKKKTNTRILYLKNMNSNHMLRKYYHGQQYNQWTHVCSRVQNMALRGNMMYPSCDDTSKKKNKYI